MILNTVDDKRIECRAYLSRVRLKSIISKRFKAKCNKLGYLKRSKEDIQKLWTSDLYSL